jgi:hypothetical protein
MVSTDKREGISSAAASNLTDDQRSIVANEARELRSKIAQHKAAVAREQAKREEASLADSTKLAGTDTREAVAKEYGLPRPARERLISCGFLCGGAVRVLILFVISKVYRKRRE